MTGQGLVELESGTGRVRVSTGQGLVGDRSGTGRMTGQGLVGSLPVPDLSPTSP